MVFLDLVIGMSLVPACSIGQIQGTDALVAVISLARTLWTLWHLVPVELSPGVQGPSTKPSRQRTEKA
jgi:hypothetical protein